MSGGHPTECKSYLGEATDRNTVHSVLRTLSACLAWVTWLTTMSESLMRSEPHNHSSIRQGEFPGPPRDEALADGVQGFPPRAPEVRAVKRRMRLITDVL